MGRRWSRPRWERKGHGRPYRVLSVLANRVLWAPVAGYSEYFPTGDSGAVLGVLSRIAPRLPPRSLYPFRPRLNLARTLAPTPPHDSRRMGCPPQLVVRASHCSRLAARRPARVAHLCRMLRCRTSQAPLSPAVPPRLPRRCGTARCAADAALCPPAQRALACGWRRAAAAVVVGRSASASAARRCDGLSLCRWY
jgi:hypothetical protein